MVLFNEQDNEQLGHIGDRHAAGEQEQPFDRPEEKGGLTCRGERGGMFRNAFMKERFADISGEQRESAYSERARKEHGHQERFFSAESPDLVEIQPVRVHIDRACRKEQNQLEEGMIQHVEKSSGCCGGGFRTENRNHADACQNETDLRNGGAGKRALQVDGKQSEHCAKHHRDGTQNEDQGAPFRV